MLSPQAGLSGSRTLWPQYISAPRHFGTTKLVTKCPGTSVSVPKCPHSGHHISRYSRHQGCFEYILEHKYEYTSTSTIPTTRSAWQSQTWGRPSPQVRVQSQFRYSRNSSRTNGSYSEWLRKLYPRTTWRMDLHQLAVYEQCASYNFFCGPKFIKSPVKVW